MEILILAAYLFGALIGIIVLYMVVRAAVRDGIVLAHKLMDKADLT